ncbi:MAG: hypothetical protein ACETWM_19995 [Candidatus Lokiarchaeia archaeon]
MSKKAVQVAEAEPKFKQPWLGFLIFLSVLGAAYVVYQWFLHPVWGYATSMVTGNAFVYSLFMNNLGLDPSLGILLSLNNPMYMALYPLGYLVDWVPYFVFCIVWVFTIAYLALWVPVKPLKRQPWGGIGVLALSAILAYITWYIFAIMLGWSGYEMILLGTCGFLIFPIWLTMFNYWPLNTPTRMGWHPVIKGAFFATISWILALVVYWIVTMLIWSNPIATSWTQYILGDVMMPNLIFEPYDLWVSLILSIIVGAVIMSIVNPWTGMSQPKRGLLLFVIAIILGVAMWFIITAALNPSSQTLLISEPVPWLFTFPYTSHAVVAAYVAFPLVTLLAGQLAFQMWPWGRWGTKGNVGLVITAFVVGTIFYYLFMVDPGFAIPLLGGNLVAPMSGLETLYLYQWGLYLVFSGLPFPFYTLAPGFLWDFIVYMLYFEGIAEFVGHALMFAWVLTVVLFGLLAYEAFDHWPWK